MNTRKQLSDVQTIFAIFVGIILSAGPVYLAIKGNPWPCIVLFIASQIFIKYRKNKLSQVDKNNF